MTENTKREQGREAKFGKCPFCGCDAVLHDCGELGFVVRCENELCAARPSEFGRTLEEAAEKWSRRAEEAAGVEKRPAAPEPRFDAEGLSLFYLFRKGYEVLDSFETAGATAFVAKDDGVLTFVFSALVDEFGEPAASRREAEDAAMAWLAENGGAAVDGCRVRFDDFQMRAFSADKALFRLVKDYLGELL